MPLLDRLRDRFGFGKVELDDKEKEALAKQRILTDDEAKSLVKKMKRVFIDRENKFTYRDTGVEIENDADIYITLPNFDYNKQHRKRVHLGKRSDIDFTKGYIYVKDPSDHESFSKYDAKIMNNKDDIETGLFLRAIPPPPPPSPRLWGIFGGKSRRRRRNRSMKRRSHKSKSYL
jgi:hypothetical protein